MSVISKLITIPSEIAWKSLEFEAKVVGNFYVDAFKSGDPAAYARKSSAIGLAFYGVLMYGAFRYITKDLFGEIDEIERTFSKDIAPEVKKGIEAMQEDVDKKWRSQQAELNLKLLAEDKESN